MIDLSVRFLQTIAEDDYGVWELILDGANALPGEDSARNEDVAAQALYGLLRDGLAECFYVTGGWAPGTSTSEHQSSLAQIEAVLTSSQRTDVVVKDSEGERSYWIRITPSGEQRVEEIDAGHR